MSTRTVRVRSEVEDLVQLYAEKYAAKPLIVRSVAMLYGLQIMVLERKIPRDSVEYYNLLRRTKKLIECMGVVV